MKQKRKFGSCGKEYICTAKVLSIKDINQEYTYFQKSIGHLKILGAKMIMTKQDTK